MQLGNDMSFTEYGNSYLYNVPVIAKDNPIACILRSYKVSVNIELRDCLNLFNLTDVINEPTRVVENSATLIDPVLVSDACIVLESGTIQVDTPISDHKATYVMSQIVTIVIKVIYSRGLELQECRF